MPELSLVLPCYNEEATVEKVAGELINDLDTVKADFELILVDNGSKDSTRENIRALSKKDSRIRLVVVKKNIGYGFGILSGLKESKGKYLGYAWADDQVPGEKTAEVFKRLKKGNCDLCKAKRVARHDGFSRKLQSSAYNSFFRLLFGINVSDVNGCPKIMTRETYETVSPKSKDWFIDPEIIIKAARAGKRIEEVPVVFRKRKAGSSNVNILTSLEFFKNMLQCMCLAKSG